MRFGYLTCRLLQVLEHSRTLDTSEQTIFLDRAYKSLALLVSDKTSRYIMNALGLCVQSPRPNVKSLRRFNETPVALY